MRRIEFPDAHDTFGLRLTRDERNALIEREMPATLDDALYAVSELETLALSERVALDALEEWRDAERLDGWTVENAARVAADKGEFKYLHVTGESYFEDNVQIDATVRVLYDLVAQNLQAYSVDAPASDLTLSSTFYGSEIELAEQITLSDDLWLTAQIAKYKNTAVVGWGVPAIIGHGTADAQSDIAGDDFPNAQATGEYRASIYLECDSVDSGTSTVHGRITWIDSGGGNTIGKDTDELTMDSVGKYVTMVIYFRHNGGGSYAVHWETVYSGASADTYLVRTILERVY